MQFKSPFVAFLAHSLLSVASPTSPNLTPRQYWGFGSSDLGTCCTGDCVYSPVGDGNPHEDFYHVQVSQPETCGPDPGQTCAATQTESHTVGWSFSGGISAQGWVSAGFDVSESYTSGDSYSCTGNPGEKVCVWLKVAHTAYTVDLSDISNGVNGVCSTQDFGPLVMESPNTDNADGGYVSSCAFWDDVWVLIGTVLRLR